MAVLRKCSHGVKTLWISWSSLKTHTDCKQRGHLQRTGSRAPLNNSRVFFPGTVVDRVVRDWLREDPENNLGAMPGMVESILDREKEEIETSGGAMTWKDKDDKNVVLRDCIEAVKRIEPDLVERVLPYDWEADFKFRAPLMLPHPDGTMEQVILNGAMDIIVRRADGTYGVWDVKMTRNDNYWRSTVGQLTFYDTAMTVMFGQPSYVAGLLQPMCKERVMPYPITQDLRYQMFSRIAAMADDVWRGDTEPRADTSQCSFCAVKHACSKFKPVVVEGKRRVAF